MKFSSQSVRTTKLSPPPKTTYFLCLMVQKSSMLIIRPNSWKKVHLWFHGNDRNGICAYLEECYNDGNNADNVKLTNQQKLKGFQAALVPPKIGSLFSNGTIFSSTSSLIKSHQHQLTFCNHLLHHSRIPRIDLVTLSAVSDSTTSVPTCLVANSR